VITTATRIQAERRPEPPIGAATRMSRRTPALTQIQQICAPTDSKWA
jgi:hypothetical protein